MVKQPSKILEQIYRNIEEENTFVSTKPQIYWKLEGKQYVFQENLLSEHSPNNVCYIENNIPVKIKSLKYNQSGTFVAQRAKNLRSFYNVLCDSVSIGIYLADNTFSDKDELFCLSKIRGKGQTFPYKEQQVINPFYIAAPNFMRMLALISSL